MKSSSLAGFSLSAVLLALVLFAPSLRRAASFAAPPQMAALVINEYLADPPGSAAGDLIGDANGDGSRDSSADEFIELVNTGATPLDVGGFTISDAVAARFTFAQGTTIPPGEAAVVFGGGAPVGEFGNARANALVFVAPAGLSLNNTGSPFADSIIVRDAAGNEIARRDYPAADGGADQSLTRDPDASGGFVRHTLASGSGGSRFSPGARVNGRPFTTTDPVVESLAPNTVVAGGGDVIVAVGGQNFQPASLVRVQGMPVSTEFLSASLLRATVPAGLAALPGEYAVTVESPGAPLSNALPLTVLAGVGLNEILADPPDGPEGDANLDGTRSSSADEFIEIVNRTSAPVAAGGFRLSDGDGVRFTFPPGAVIPAGEAAVIFGGGAPAGEFGNARANGLIFIAPLALSNSGETLTLADAAGAPLDTVHYGAAEGGANQSINRDPEPVGARFGLHAALAPGRLFSPGARLDGQPFTTAPRLVSITPDNVPLGARPFSLTVSGSGFESGASAFIDGEPVETEVLNAGEIVARVPASVTAAAGGHAVEVRNPGGNRSNALTLRVVPPPPVLHRAVPSALLAGMGDARIMALGAAFEPASVVLVGDQPVATQFVHARLLMAIVPAALTESPAVLRVRVRNGDGQESQDVALTVFRPGPRLLRLSPDQMMAGAAEFFIIVKGQRFASGAVVWLDGTPLETQTISADELRARVPPALIAESGTRAVAVENPDGSRSNEAALRVAPRPPRLRSLAPQSVSAGEGEVALALAGEGFHPGAVVRVLETTRPGASLETHFVDAARLRAVLPARFTERPGALALRVENPDFGFSNAVSLAVLIDDPLVINEYLADPPDGRAGDANLDGTRSSSADEFVEILNRGAEPFDLSGYTLADSDSVRHVFAAGTVLPPFEAAVVFGGGSPRGEFGNAAENRLVFRASSGGLSLNNGGDEIILKDAAGRLIQRIVFGPLEGSADQSFNRDPDAGGARFARHTQVSGAARRFSPGARATGEPFTRRPRISALHPSSVRAGGPAAQVSISGANFEPGAVVLFDEVALECEFLSADALRVVIPAPLVAAGGAAGVRVRNPRGELSSAATFLMTDDPPRLIRLSPARVGTGAGGVTVEVGGERLQRGARLLAGQEAVETHFVDAARLRAVLPERFFARAGRLDLRVVNADGNRSNAVTLEIAPGPLLTRVPRRRLRAGGGDLVWRVGGVALQPGVVLLVNGEEVPTDFVLETEIRIRIPASLTAQAGELILQARNPDFGRSNRLTIRVE